MNYQIVKSGSFESENHWYPKAHNATIHPMIDYFLNLSKERIVERYCHLNPKVKRDFLHDVLSRKPKYFRWSGSDLINVTTENGVRQMVIIENNSCPSGQKSMPLLNDHDEYGGYRRLIQDTFIPSLKNQRLVVDGVMAVIYDKNPMEASGYAATMADLMDEDIYYIKFPKEGYSDYLKHENGVLKLKKEDGEWVNIRAAFRYVTQKPWNRIPIHSKTKILNPTLACISGGRNKMVAAKAYDLFNAELADTGLSIKTPETIWDVRQNEVPIWVKKMGGYAVVKVPYSNAGQGVYTIVNEQELEDFMNIEFEYDKFIVQSLIGNYNWSSISAKGRYYHVGTLPNNKGYTYVSDLRMMIQSTREGFRPLCVYSRRSRSPLLDTIEKGCNSWDMLGTNLSFKINENEWGSDTNRLMLMGRRDFNKLGIGMDDLIEAYIQSVLSTIAIDNMAKTFINSKGKFRKKLFQSFNNDEHLMDEIMIE